MGQYPPMRFFQPAHPQQYLAQQPQQPLSPMQAGQGFLPPSPPLAPAYLAPAHFGAASHPGMLSPAGSGLSGECPLDKCPMDVPLNHGFASMDMPGNVSSIPDAATPGSGSDDDEGYMGFRVPGADGLMLMHGHAQGRGLRATAFQAALVTPKTCGQQI